VGQRVMVNKLWVMREWGTVSGPVCLGQWVMENGTICCWSTGRWTIWNSGSICQWVIWLIYQGSVGEWVIGQGSMGRGSLATVCLCISGLLGLWDNGLMSQCIRGSVIGGPKG